MNTSPKKPEHANKRNAVSGAPGYEIHNKNSDICRDCGESISECPVRHQEGMRAGLCGICNDIATEIECEEECGF